MSTAVQQIIKQIVHGDGDAAQATFRAAASRASVGDIARALGEATSAPRGTIIAGPALLVWANPFRTDYGWRCGDCRWTAGLYKTRRNAEKSAAKHAEEHPGIIVRWITRPVST